MESTGSREEGRSKWADSELEVIFEATIGDLDGPGPQTNVLPVSHNEEGFDGPQSITWPGVGRGSTPRQFFTL